MDAILIIFSDSKGQLTGNFSGNQVSDTGKVWPFFFFFFFCRLQQNA